MRKLIFVCCLFSILFLVFYSCKKESQNGTAAYQTSELTNSGNRFIPYYDIKIINGMLAFKDTGTFINTLAALKEECIKWSNDFNILYNNLSYEERDSIQRLIGWNEDQPLINFENQFPQFYSLRKDIDTKEKAWLNDEDPDWEKNPDNHFIVEEELRTLMNASAQFTIDDVVYQFTDTGYSYYKEPDLTDETGWTGGGGGFSGGGSSGGGGSTGNSGSNGGGSGTCRSDRRKEGNEPNSFNNRRINWVISHWTYPWERRVMAKTKNYKKKNNGKWTGYSTDCVAKPYGNISGIEGDCSTQIDFNPNNYSRTDSDHKVKFEILVSTKTQSGWVQGYHSGGEGIIYTSTLTW